MEKFRAMIFACWKDDKHFFPRYDAVIFAQKDFPQKYPRTWAALKELEGTIDENMMSKLNAEVEIDKKTFAEVAATHLGNNPTKPKLFGPKLWKLTKEHAVLVFVSVFFAVLLALPLGILAYRSKLVAQPVFAGNRGVANNSIAGTSLFFNSRVWNWYYACVGGSIFVCALTHRA